MGCQRNSIQHLSISYSELIIFQLHKTRMSDILYDKPPRGICRDYPNAPKVPGNVVQYKLRYFGRESMIWTGTDCAKHSYLCRCCTTSCRCRWVAGPREMQGKAKQFELHFRIIHWKVRKPIKSLAGLSKLENLTGVSCCNFGISILLADSIDSCKSSSCTKS